MSQPFKLYRLQQTDTQIDQLKNRLDQIEIEIQDDVALRNAEKNAERTEKELQESRRLFRIADDNLQKQKSKIKSTESRLYSGNVKNPKELQDLENESVSLKRFLSVLEDRYLEALLHEEELAAKDTSAGNELITERENYSNKLSMLEGERMQQERRYAYYLSAYYPE